jgi:hypothetical protein
MGYSHYWYRPQGHDDRAMFQRLGTDARRIIATAKEHEGIDVAGWDGNGSPEFTEIDFRMNGRTPEKCETFVWESRAIHPEWETDHTRPVFGCVKTRQHPYDAVVCAILIRAKVIYGDSVRLSSDGEWSHEWVPGRTLYLATFDELAPCPFGADHLIGGE